MINSDKITLIRNNGESFELNQSRVKIRENHKGLMAVSYISPVFEAMDLEEFFSDFLTSEKLKMDIGGTGEFTVAFRGLIEGKGGNLPQNFEHKIILLQEPKNLDPRSNVQNSSVSKFKKGYTLS